jgi:hypothetical protein
LDLERICDEEEYKFNKKREVVKSNWGQGRKGILN